MLSPIKRRQNATINCSIMNVDKLKKDISTPAIKQETNRTFLSTTSELRSIIKGRSTGDLTNCFSKAEKPLNAKYSTKAQKKVSIISFM